MNIILFTDDFYPNLGGIADVLINLYKQFDKQEETLFLFNPYSKGKNLFDTLTIDNLKLRRFGYLIMKRKFYIYVLLSFWSILRDKKIPFFHRLKIISYLFIKPKTFLYVINNLMVLYPTLKNMEIDLIISGNSGRTLQLSFIISKILRKKLITIAYGLDFLKKNKYSFKSHYFRNTDKVIVITNKTKEIIKEMHHIDEERLEVINVGINIDSLEVEETKLELRKEYNIDKDEFVILSVGRHIQRKNFQLVIRTLDKIANRLYASFFIENSLMFSFNIKYYLIGEGEETDNLKQLTKDLNLENHVTFLGQCDINTRNKYYKMSDLFIMPSITSKTDIEGFGIVFLEANYFKVPVIGTATGGMSEAIVDGGTGFLIKQNDINDLSDKIMFLYNNESKRKEIGINGHYRVIRDFKWENIIKKYINLIRKLD